MSNHEQRTKNEEPLIKVSGVSKKFCLSLKKSLWYGLCDMGRELTGRRHGASSSCLVRGSSFEEGKTPVGSVENNEPRTTNQELLTVSQEQRTKNNEQRTGLRPKEFWAVHDVSFELKRGECLGLIGRNGAGKTTLLKMLNGLIKPDAGRIEMRGRVGALIALGAGFNPILTGRENIYVNGSVLGLSKREIDAKMDEIIDFAEIGDFIDTPVQNYSSGMAVRLGFGVAAVLIKPDILLLDEVLAVGDMGFTIKCLNAVRQLAYNTAVVFVSHNMQFVSSFCNRVIVMKDGKPYLDTLDVVQGVDTYLALFPKDQSAAGTGEVMIDNIRLVRGEEEFPDGSEPLFNYGDRLTVRFDAIADATIPEDSSLFFQIDDGGIAPVVSFAKIEGTNGQPALRVGHNRIEADLGVIDFTAGHYSLVIGAGGGTPLRTFTRRQGLGKFRVKTDRVHWGKIVRNAVVKID